MGEQLALPVFSKEDDAGMTRMNKWIKKLELIVGAIMLISIVILVFASAWFRVLRHPLVWSVDASQLMFVWISMFGADLALKKGTHMGVDLLTKKFPQSIQKVIALFTYVLCSTFVIFVIYWGTNLCIENYLRKYSTLQISYSFATAAVPIVCLFMLMTLIEQIINLVSNWKKPFVNE